jgi:hypothetical protein
VARLAAIEAAFEGVAVIAGVLEGRLEELVRYLDIRTPAEVFWMARTIGGTDSYRDKLNLEEIN